MAKASLDLSPYLQAGLNPALAALIQNFYQSYRQAAQQSGYSVEKSDQLFQQLIELVMQQLKQPYQFEIFHRSIHHPFDYYQFGLDFIRPLVDFKSSKIFGIDFVHAMIQQIKKGENVILLANHQTEPDPQILSLLLEKIDAQFASQMIFVAGHRVISDPMAIPMSMGRNLLCIYSKKHISHPPEQKAQKVSHNQKTMKKMSELLSQGGQCIYVAPSGGRDRSTAEGKIEIAPFDPQSIEMFWLMAQQAEHPTHFYPLSLHTYNLMPPPKQVEKEIGEKRQAYFTPIHLAFGPEIDMEHFPGNESSDKKTKRNKRADYIWSTVKSNYQLFDQPLDCPPRPLTFLRKADSSLTCATSSSPKF